MILDRFLRAALRLFLPSRSNRINTVVGRRAAHTKLDLELLAVGGTVTAETRTLR